MDKKTEFSPNQIAATKLYFMNLLNQAGASDKPIIFEDYYSAQQACPGLSKICERLTVQQVGNLIDRIENIL